MSTAQTALHASSAQSSGGSGGSHRMPRSGSGRSRVSSLDAPTTTPPVPVTPARSSSQIDDKDNEPGKNLLNRPRTKSQDEIQFLEQFSEKEMMDPDNFKKLTLILTSRAKEEHEKNIKAKTEFLDFFTQAQALLTNAAIANQKAEEALALQETVHHALKLLPDQARMLTPENFAEFKNRLKPLTQPKAFQLEQKIPVAALISAPISSPSTLPEASTPPPSTPAAQPQQPPHYAIDTTASRSRSITASASGTPEESGSSRTPRKSNPVIIPKVFQNPG